MKSISRHLFAIALYIGVIPFVQAEKVSMTLPSGLVVNAAYTPGDPQKPALLVLHGFLQTREFQATKNIIDGLSDMGYEVLGPSLSLGVGNRRKSLSCEAPHTHTLQGDLEELDRWVDWLLKKGHHSMLLVGHSWGGQHALAYAAQYPQRPIVGVVAVSLVRARQDEATLTAQKKQAQVRLDAGTLALNPYALNFCKKYVGIAQSYLSYAAWTDAKVIATVKASPVPVHVILGSEDRRIDSAWVSALRASGAEVSTVDGADHFFSSQYEFDLLDELAESLKTFEHSE